jgi:hypothetical protein
MVGHGVDQPDLSVVLRRAIRDERRLHVVFLQVKSQVQPGDSGADDPDIPRHVSLPSQP